MTSDDARPPQDDSDDAVSFTRPRSTATAEPDDRRPPARPDDPDDDDYPDDRRRVVVIAAVVFVVIALVGFALTRGGGSDDTAEPTTGAPGASAPGGDGATVTISGTEDTFDRPDTNGGVDPLPNGVRWDFPNGTWDIRNGEVTLVAPSDTRNFMVVDVGLPDVQAQVRLSKAVSGAGLTFRYQDEFHFWALEPSPENSAINIIKVDTEALGPPNSLGVFRTVKDVPVADGSTVGVILTGDQIQVILDGKVVDSFEDPYLAGTGGVGLTARGTVEAPRIGDARWDDFVAGGPTGEGIIGAGGEGLPSADGEEPTAPTEPGAEVPAEDPGSTDTTAGG